MITGCADPFDRGILRVSTVFRFHGRDDIVHKLIVELIGQLKGKAVIAAVPAARVVVRHHDEDHRLHLAVFNGVIGDELEVQRVIRRAHNRSLVAPAAVTQVKNIVLLIFRVAVRKIHPGFFCQGLRMFLIGEGLPGLIGQLFQSAGMIRWTIITLRNQFQFSWDPAFVLYRVIRHILRFFLFT